jgi:hypothetical protein
MSMQDFFDLQPGSEFVVYYAKDDDPDCVHFDFERRTVVQAGCAVVDDRGDDWDDEPSSVPDRSDNLYDTSRGYAYFFHAGGRTRH